MSEKKKIRNPFVFTSNNITLIIIYYSIRSPQCRPEMLIRYYFQHHLELINPHSVEFSGAMRRPQNQIEKFTLAINIAYRLNCEFTLESYGDTEIVNYGQIIDEIFIVRFTNWICQPVRYDTIRWPYTRLSKFTYTRLFTLTHRQYDFQVAITHVYSWNR